MPLTVQDIGIKPLLGNRFAQALSFAFYAHNEQVRKGEINCPYFSHLLAVASLVLEAGGNEDQAIAALLHDCVEDAKVNPLIIEEKFGRDVNYIIFQLTEDKSLPKDERKANYAESVLSISNSAIRVSVADKLHNLRCYAQDQNLCTPAVRDFYERLLRNYGVRCPGLGQAIMSQREEMIDLFEKIRWL